MIEIIKNKEIKGIFTSLLLMVLGILLMLKPLEIVESLIKIMGIVILLCGVLDFLNYFRIKTEEKLFNYGLLKGLLEVSIGILFIFKFNVLTDIFTIIIGLIIIFMNVFKLQLSLNLKEVNTPNWFIGTIISSLSIILGIVIILNPFSTVKVIIITSGAIIFTSELANIIYSFIILKSIKKESKNIKDIVVKEVK